MNRALRQALWPPLRDSGFNDRTQRVAWRRLDDGVDLVEIRSIGSDYDSIGCTSFSFTAYVAALMFSNRSPFPQPTGKARYRPHYWQCEPFVHRLSKALAQPWFRPFKRPAASLVKPMRIHREGLEQIFRTDVHDRRDVWFVLEDGSNLDLVIEDLVAVVSTVGLPMLSRFHDPERRGDPPG